MPVHGRLVERVHLGRFGSSARGNDVSADSFHGCLQAPGEENRGSLAREGACDSAADRTAGSVDHRNLVLQQHR